MTLAYVDTSVLLAIAFREPGCRELQERLSTYPRAVSSNLLEAELRSGLAREGMDFEADFLAGIGWILPYRSLRTEIDLALSAGYLKGADLWHVATALYVSPAPEETVFFTRDRRQRSVAQALGLRVQEASP